MGKAFAIVYLSCRDLNFKFLKKARKYADVIIIDSGSVASDLKRAESIGCDVRIRYRKPWDAGAQRNYAVALLRENYDWLLFLDADEYPTDSLVGEIQQFVSDSGDYKAAAIPSIYILGKPLARTCRNTYHHRLIRTSLKKDALFTESPGEVLKLHSGEIKNFMNGYLHSVLQKGYLDWLKRMFIYPLQNGKLDAEGRAYYKNFRGIRANKILLAPLLPVAYFGYYLLIRRCYLDGLPGLHFALVMSLAQITYPVGYLIGKYQKCAR